MADDIVLRSLRVSSDLDASGYTRGAREMADAQAQLSAGNRMVVVTLAEANQKVSQAGDPVARLSRTYVDGRAEALKFEQGLRSLNRALEAGRVDGNLAQQIYQGMTQKLGMVADGTGIAAQGFTKLGTVVENVNRNIVQGTAATERFIQIARQAQVEANAAQAATANQGRFNQLLGVSSGPVTSARDSASVFLDADRAAERAAGDYQRRLAAIRAEIDPITAATERLNAELAEMSFMFQRGDLTASQFAAGQDRARARVAALRYEVEQHQRTQNLGGNMLSAVNSAQQLQDILITAQMGQSIPLIAMQQGTQLGMSAMMSGGGAGAVGLMNSLRTSVMALMNPIMLASVAFAGATAAAVQFFLSGEKAKTLDDQLKDTRDAVMALADAYGVAGAKAADFERQRQIPAMASARTEAELLRRQAMDEIRRIRGGTVFSEGEDLSTAGSLFEEVTSLYGFQFGSNKAAVQFTPREQFRDFADPLRQWNEELQRGIPNFEALERGVEDVVRKNEDLRETADEILRIATAAADAAHQLEIANIQIDRMRRGNSVGGPAAMDRNQDEFNRLREEQRQERLAQEAIEADQRQREFDAERAQIRARTFAERTQAARIAAQADQSGSPMARADRERIAVQEELLTQEMELRDAAKMRSDQRRASVEQLKIEAATIGQTAGEIARMNEQYRMWTELREQAERTGTIISDEEYQRVVETANEVARLVELNARLQLRDDATFDRDQLFRTSNDRAIAGSQRGAGLPVDLGSDEARYMRHTFRLEEARQTGIDFLSAMRDSIIDGGDDLGEVLLRQIQDGFIKASDIFIEQIANSFAKAMLGSGTAGDAGLLGKWFPSVFGAGGSPLSSPPAAATAANDNFAAPVGAVMRAPLADVTSFASAGLTKGGIPLASVNTASGLSARVAADYADRFQGLFNDLEAAGYKISSLGEGGYSFRNVAGTNNLSKHAFGEAVDINPRTNPWSHRFQTDMPANVDEIARQNGLTWGGNWRKPDTMHFQVDKSVEMLSSASEKAATSVSTMATSSLDAAKSVGGMAQSMANFFPAAPAAPGGGGGGLFGWLGSLFGGGLPSMSYMNAFSPSAATYIAGGGMAGLFHDGGIAGFATQFRSVDPRAFIGAPRYHGGGFAGDEVPAILRRGEPVFKSMEHARQVVGNDNRRREARPINIFVNGARGNAEIQEMVSAGVRQGLASEREADKYGASFETDHDYRRFKL